MLEKDPELIEMVDKDTLEAFTVLPCRVDPTNTLCNNVDTARVDPIAVLPRIVDADRLLAYSVETDMIDVFDVLPDMVDTDMDDVSTEDALIVLAKRVEYILTLLARVLPVIVEHTICSAESVDTIIVDVVIMLSVPVEYDSAVVVILDAVRVLPERVE
jgi:hypothetical protein